MKNVTNYMANKNNNQNKLARSEGHGYTQQSYTDHINGVYKFLLEFMNETLPYVQHMKIKDITHTLINAVIYHDLGKLEELNQKVLNGITRTKLPIPHEDAGSAYWQLKKDPCLTVAILIYAHHKGLPNIMEEYGRGDSAFRSTKDKGIPYKLLDIHLKEVIIKNENGKNIAMLENSIDWRIILSLLVDADHSDAAKHCLQYYGVPLSKYPRWDERLKQLDQKILDKSVKSTNNTEKYRNKLRTEMYYGCRDTKIADNIVQCEAAVGSGKTTAVLAYLLNRAQSEKEQPKQLFIIAPYTNLICQLIDTLRDLIVLPGEDPQEIVVGHYHTADYTTKKTRHLSVLWKARIIVTTSVQFFETLAAAKTTALRKLHSLPGSMIYIDEFDAALPYKLWPIAWRWVELLVNNWNCKFVLASGSGIAIWNIGRDIKLDIKSIVPVNIKTKLIHLEQDRITYTLLKKPLNIKALSDTIMQYGTWPKLVIMNTVQNAAILTKYMCENEGLPILHLSTTFTPKDRKVIVKKIKDRLAGSQNKKWLLIATSCVEAGMDFSFATGFREAFNLSSIIQPGGRVNRNFINNNAYLYIYTTCGKEFNKHPNADTYNVLQYFNKNNILDNITIQKLLKNAASSIWNNTIDKFEVQQMIDTDICCDFKIVDSTFNVIEADTKTVLISDHIRWKIERGYKVKWQDIQNNSVQLWSTKINKLGLTTIKDTDIYYIQEDLYDSKMFGMMKYVFAIDKLNMDNCII